MSSNIDEPTIEGISSPVARRLAALQQAKQTEAKYYAAKGLRDDKNKLGIHMLPVFALEEIAKVFDYGKNKYSRDGYDATDNWRKGLSWRSTVGSLLRHSFAFLRGQDRDEESGLYHMAHVGANALFLLQFLITNGGTDDRYKESEAHNKTSNTKAFYEDPIDF